MAYAGHHEMLLAEVHPTGVEEWYCPTCGRRLLFSWPPDFRRVILNAGDEDVTHSGSRNDPHVERPRRGRGEEIPALSVELRAALEDALADVDFGGLDDGGD